jgi:hypothetical protein
MTNAVLLNGGHPRTRACHMSYGDTASLDNLKMATKGDVALLDAQWAMCVAGGLVGHMMGSSQEGQEVFTVYRDIDVRVGSSGSFKGKRHLQRHTYIFI